MVAGVPLGASNSEPTGTTQLGDLRQQQRVCVCGVCGVCVCVSVCVRVRVCVCVCMWWLSLRPSRPATAASEGAPAPLLAAFHALLAPLATGALWPVDLLSF